MQENPNWATGCPVAITVCDANGIIIEMNDRAAEVFAKDGGRALIGTDVMQCHSEASRLLMKEMMTSQTSHSYTIEKNGIKKFVHQTPWFRGREFGGLVEFSMEIPNELPHFVRS